MPVPLSVYVLTVCGAVERSRRASDFESALGTGAPGGSGLVSEPAPRGGACAGRHVTSEQDQEKRMTCVAPMD